MNDKKYIMEYYIAIKKNELDLDAWTWKNVHICC